MQWAGIPPSGVNVVRWDMRRLRTRRASARAECQVLVRVVQPREMEVIPVAEVGLVRFAHVAHEVAEAVLPSYRSKYSKHLFTEEGQGAPAFKRGMKGPLPFPLFRRWARRHPGRVAHA